MVAPEQASGLPGVSGVEVVSEIDGVRVLKAALTAGGRVARAGFFNYFPHAKNGGGVWVRAGDWKLQVSETPNRVWLFNLRTDPYEQHDLSAQEPQRVAELRALIEEHNANLPPPLWPALCS